MQNWAIFGWLKYIEGWLADSQVAGARYLLWHCCRDWEPSAFPVDIHIACKRLVIVYRFRIYTFIKFNDRRIPSLYILMTAVWLAFEPAVPLGRPIMQIRIIFIAVASRQCPAVKREVTSKLKSAATFLHVFIHHVRKMCQCIIASIFVRWWPIFKILQLWDLAVNSH